LAKEIFKDGAMEAALVPEVVVEHRLIGMGFGSDLVRARTGHALRRKMALGGGEDAPRCGRVLDFSASQFH
jgi:hypothetical protein